MDKFKLQDYNGGAIYKHNDGSYSVETTYGTGKGATVHEALVELSENINARFTVVDHKKQSKNIIKRKNHNKKD